MVHRRLGALVAIFFTLLASASCTEASTGANPIRRVVNMLQAMRAKVEAEGKKEESLFDKFMCYCKSGGEALKTSISEAEGKVPQIESTIKESSAEKSQLTSEVAQHKKDRDAAKASVAEATAVREKGASDYAKESGEMSANIAAMSKAIAALKKGSGASFLQSAAAAVVRRVAAAADLGDSDRELLGAFLSDGEAGSSSEASPGEIIGIMEQLKETTEGDLAEAVKAEEQAKADFESLTAAKAKEIGALQKAIEDKMTRLGEVGVELVNAKEDLEATNTALAEDTKFLKDLEADCGTKSAEWEERQKTRSEELIAIAETVKILNDDDALDLFKKTLPSPSLLQVQASTGRARRKRAAQAYLAQAARTAGGDHRLALLSSELHGRSRNFDKVLTMVDDMVGLLGKEQTADEEKKAFCQKELDSSEDQKKVLDLAISDLEKVIENTKSSLASIAEEIGALQADIKRLDKDVAGATERRKEENANFQEERASNSAAKELLALAKNRLQKFYNPKLATTTPPPEVSEADRISDAFGGASFVQVSTHASAHRAGEKPGPAPEVPTGGYKKKGAESGGVLAMIDMLSADLDKDIQEAEVEEKNSQSAYERFMQEAAAKRSTDAKTIAEKEGQKADQEALLNKRSLEQKEKTAEAVANAKYTAELHKGCDWLLANFAVRKEARAGKVESLKKAKAVLSGADYSLAQRLSLRGAKVQGH